MPPFARKFVKTRKIRKSGLRGGNFVVEDLSVKSSGSSILELASDDGSEIQIQPHNLPETIVSVPNNNLMFPNGRIIDNASISSCALYPPRMTLDLVASFIPQFDGKVESVKNFISQCKLAESIVQPEDRFYLFALIRNKIQLRDFNRISNGKELGTVEDLLKSIKSTYYQGRTIKKSLDEFKFMQRKDGESVGEFGARVQEILISGMEVAKEKLKPEQLVGIENLFKEEAIAGFLKGLGNEMIRIVILKDNVKELRTAIRLASKLEDNLESKVQPKESKFLSSKFGVFAVNSEQRCFLCNKMGHFRKDCPLNRNKGYNQNFIRCRNCRKTGHVEANCYNKIRETIWEKPQPKIINNTKSQDDLNLKRGPLIGARWNKTPLKEHTISTTSAANLQ